MIHIFNVTCVGPGIASSISRTGFTVYFSYNISRIFTYGIFLFLQPFGGSNIILIILVNQARYFTGLYGCLYACLNPINVKTAEPIVLKFCLEPSMTPRKVYGCSKLQKLPQKNSNPRKNIIDSVNFFCVFFILYKRKNLTDRATIKS